MTDAVTPAAPLPPTPVPGAPAPIGPSPAPVAAAPAPAPRAPALDPSTRRQTVLVAAVLAALFFGSQVVNEALPGGTQQVDAGQTVAVGQFATLTAIAGWELSSHESGSGVRLEKGVVVLDLFPVDGSSDASGLAELYQSQGLESQATELTTTELELASEGSVTGARFRYQGIFTGAQGPIEGEVTAIVRGGHGVAADAWAPQGDLASLIEEVRLMVSTIEIQP